MRRFLYKYPLKVGYVFEGYKITQQLGLGFRGLTYLADAANGQKVVIKIPRLDLNRPYEVIVDRLRQIERDVNQELRAWRRLRESPETAFQTADVYDAGAVYFEIVRGEPDGLVPFIIQEYIDGPGLIDWCKSTFANPSGEFRGIPTAHAWFSIASKLARLVSVVHVQRVVHGDIWPPNIIIRKTDTDDVLPVLIDFGQAWLIESDFSKSARDGAYEYYAPERTEEGQVWTEAADIYSLGGLFYYLATGSDPISVYEDGRRRRFKTHYRLKNEISTILQKGNPTLYKECPGIADIILYAMRPNVHERAPHADAVIEVMEIFRNAFTTQQDTLHAINIGNEVQYHLEKAAELLQHQVGENELFNKLVMRQISSLRKQVQTLSSRVYNLGGDRESIINGLLTCFASLGHGDTCYALTTPIFWREHNFGINGRFLTMLKMAVLKAGINVRWVIVLSKSELYEDEVSQILRAQQQLVIELGQNGQDIDSKQISGEAGCYIGYSVVSDEERNAIAQAPSTFLMLRRMIEDKPVHTMFAPRYNLLRDGRVTLVRLWLKPNRVEALLTSLEGYLQKSKNVKKYKVRKH